MTNSPNQLLLLRHLMLIQNEHAVRLQVEIAGKCVACKEIVHRFIKLDAKGRTLMVEKEKDVGIVFLAHADFDLVRHFEQRMNVAHLTKPSDQIGVEMLMALGADIDSFSKAKSVHGHGRAAGVEILGIGGENLATLGFDNVAP